MITATDTATPMSLVTAASTATAKRIHGRRLVLTRMIWIGVAVLTAIVVGATIPDRYAALRHVVGTDLSPTVYAGYKIGLFGLSVAVFEGVAALLVWQRPGARMTFLSALALVTFPVYASPQGVIGHLAPPLDWIGAGLDLTGVVALTLSIYLVPDGRFMPRWTGWLITPWVVILSPHVFFPTTMWDFSTWPVPLSPLAAMSGIGPALCVMLYRYSRVSTSIERRQTGWLIRGVVLAVGIVLVTELVVRLLHPTIEHNLLASAAADTVRVAAALLVPVAIAFAIVRYRLWAIDLLISRTLVYGLLTASVIGLYVLVVGTLSTVLAGQGDVAVSLIATGLVAVVFQPLRERLQRSVNRLLYGERDHPYQLLSRLGRRLEETLAPDAVFPTVVETVARALKLPYVAISLPRDGSTVIVAAHGTPVPSPLVLPLVYRQETIGQLLVAPRAGSENLNAADRRLFMELTRQATAAIHAAELRAKATRLAEELQQARTRLVTLREEERRRLRRDLHDGLGPALASVTLQAENARDLLRSDPAQAEAVLDDLTMQAQAAIGDIRRVVYELRPPALDDLGLVDAVRTQANRLSGQDLRIRVDAQVESLLLPAAVEVAAYLIIQEALTNVVRHAGAQTCIVRLRLQPAEFGETLLLDIMDDGHRLPPVRSAGVGLHSMHTRAAELCGTCTVEARTRGETGTLVSAVLPLECPGNRTPREEDW